MKSRKILSLLLCCAMLFAMFGTSVLAEDDLAVEIHDEDEQIEVFDLTDEVEETDKETEVGEGVGDTEEPDETEEGEAAGETEEHPIVDPTVENPPFEGHGHAELPWKFNGSVHTAYCEKCEKTYTVSHSALRWVCARDQHYKYCWVCDQGIYTGTGNVEVANHQFNTPEKCGIAIKCEICGYVKNAEGIPHTWKAVYTVNTHHALKCSVCGRERGTERHGFVVANGDCTQDRVCECGFVKKDSGTCGHYASSVNIKDNENGTHSAKCGFVGCKQTVTENHTWGEWTVTEVATEDQAGSRTRSCTKCKAVDEEEIPMITPAPTAEPTSVATAEPAPTDSASENGVAAAGSRQGSDVIETVGPTEEPGETEEHPTVDPTEEEPKFEGHGHALLDWEFDGYAHTAYCPMCDKTYTVTHALLRWVCARDQHYKYCWVCDKGMDYPESGNIEVGDHHYNEPDQCGIAIVCEVCSFVKNAEGIPHTWTALYTDNTQHILRCSVCGKDRGSEKHDFGVADGDCTKNFVCECGFVKKDSGTSGHYASLVDIKDNKDGTHSAECGFIGCKQTVTEEHIWGKWTVTKEATEDQAGSRTRTCTKCKAVDEEEIPMITPAPTAAPTTPAPTESATQEPEETGPAPTESATQEPEETEPAPTESATQEPEETPILTTEPEEPEATPVPTATAEPEEPEASATPAATEEPEEPEVSATPAATEEPEEPEVASTPEPTDEPEETPATTAPVESEEPEVTATPDAPVEPEATPTATEPTEPDATEPAATEPAASEPGADATETPSEEEPADPGDDTESDGTGDSDDESANAPADGETTQPDVGEGDTPSADDSNTSDAGEDNVPGKDETNAPDADESEVPGEDEADTPSADEEGDSETDAPSAEETAKPSSGTSSAQGTATKTNAAKETAAASAGILSALITVTLADGEPVAAWALDVEMLEFVPVEGATATGDVPAGDMILEIVDLEDYYDALFALNVYWELNGEEQAIDGVVTISMPVELPEGEFVLAYVEEDTTLTEVEFTYEDGVLSFDITEPGLYVMIPA